MAASVTRNVFRQTWKIREKRVLLPKFVNRGCQSSSNKLTDHASGADKDPEKLFIRQDVQQVLKKVAGFDVDRILHEKMRDIKAPQFRLLTDKQLKELQTQAIQKAEMQLQMPPVLNPRQDTEVILSEDPQIAGHDEHNIVFTDISKDLPDNLRTIVVREPSGRLRLANGDERERLLHIYYPRDGRMYHTPQMFTDPHLERLVTEERYEYVLDRACVQFDPDNHLYIQVTHRVYDAVANRGQYDMLRCTRHFGPLTFYLTLHMKADGLIADMVERDLLSDAGDVVSLYHILHPDCESARLANQQNVTESQQLVQLYADHTSRHSGEILLALQTYREIHETTKTHESQSV